ncbi:hypothetical protein [Paenibacillus sp. HJGM_3]|uniref:hypothetical protein n=1 Tax=Paenibacillus sp. HJGM_3 TaxID=3379816 RepID=UPI00385FFE3E
MLVKMKVSMAGPYESWVPGDERDVREDIAKAWEAAGIADIVDQPKPKQKAAKSNAD